MTNPEQAVELLLEYIHDMYKQYRGAPIPFIAEAEDAWYRIEAIEAEYGFVWGEESPGLAEELIAKLNEEEVSE